MSHRLLTKSPLVLLVLTSLMPACQEVNFDLAPSELHFGLVMVDQEGEQQVELKNIGEATIKARSELKDSPDFDIATEYSFDHVPWDGELKPGESQTLVVGYSPVAPGEVGALLSLVSTSYWDTGLEIGSVALYGSAQVDEDGDGYGSEDSGGKDCDDQEPAAHPDAEEIAYDGIDNDCDGEDLDDLDGDGFGADDCDDEDADVNPEAEETPYDGIDQDCSGADENDVDHDGYVAEEAGKRAETTATTPTTSTQALPSTAAAVAITTATVKRTKTRIRMAMGRPPARATAMTLTPT